MAPPGPTKPSRRVFAVVLGLIVVLAGAWLTVGPDVYITTGNRCDRRAEAHVPDTLARLVVDALATEPQWVRDRATESFNARHPTLDAFKELARLPIKTMDLIWAWRGKGRGPVVCSSGEGKADLVVLPLKGEREFAVLRYTMRRPVMHIDVVLLFLKDDNVDWGLESAAVFPSSDRGKGPRDYEADGDRELAAGRPIGASFSYLAGAALTPQIPGLQIGLGKRLRAKLKDLHASDDFRSSVSMDSIPRSHEYLSLSVMAFGNDGFYPIVSYVSDTVDERSRGESLDLMQSIQAEAPGLRSTFPGMAAMAYGEPPVDPTRQYKRFGTTMKFEDTE